MYIFNWERSAFVNSNNIKNFEIGIESDTPECYYYIKADSLVLAAYPNFDDAKEELYNIFRQLETGASSYQVM